jgi:hypothetical protein
MPGFISSIGGEVFGDGVVSVWDRFVVAGRALPGVATVKSSREVAIDERNSVGNDGATLTHTGNRSGKVDVRLRLWTQKQWDEWEKRVPELLAKSGKTRPSPVTVYHPTLAVLGIKSLICTKVDGGHAQPGGLCEIELNFVEFLPPSKAGIVTPKRAAINLDLNNAVTGQKKTGPTPVPPSKKAPGP